MINPPQDPPPEEEPHPLTDLALSRLRKLADGNGLAPEKIELIDSEEKVYTLDGVTVLAPFCDQQSARYPGPVKGKERTMMGDPAALQAAADQHQKSFMESRDWVPLAMKDLEGAPGGGWGLEGSKISLPQKSAIFAAPEMCSTCEGRKTLTCVQCQGQAVIVCIYCEGRGQEICYNCGGRGVSPANPGQPCVICQGRRYSVCRWCHNSTGKLTCPTCQGRRVTPCPICRGTGGMTLEIGLACGANINFRFTGKDLPSGLRRGIDRLGVVNLLKGHADIKVLPPEKPKEGEGAEGRAPGSPQADKAADPSYVRYMATMPYADLRMRFNDGRAVLVNVFGKKASLMSVPAFLDDSLKPWREKLHKAARGEAPLESALEARLMRDALGLELSGKGGDATSLRKMYPIGLSPKAAQEIMVDMRHAHHRFTRNIRLLAAIILGVLGAAALGGFLYAPQHAQITRPWPWWAGMGLDFGALVVVLGLCWAALGKSVQLVLKRRFPNLTISLHKTVGHIGRVMLLGIAGGWGAILFLLPIKPLWLVHLLDLVNHRM